MEEEERPEEEEVKLLSTWRPGDPVNGTAAIRAFKRCRRDLLEGIEVAGPLKLANDLYSEDVVSKDVLDQILYLNITPSEKTLRLLAPMETRFSGHPSDFTTFITVLETYPTLTAVVERLKECYVKFSASGTRTILQSCNDPFDKFVASLKEVYQKTRIFPRNEGYPKLTAEYTNLAIVKKEHTSRTEADEFTLTTLHGGIDQIMRVKKPILIENVLKVEAGGRGLRCILVEGAPGVGKSMFALQLCRRWDSIEAISKFAMVVLLRLRDEQVQNVKSIADIFYHDCHRTQERVVDRITSVSGEGVLLVLDGFDEFPVNLRRKSIIAQVIQGTCLSLAKATILVTSRPSARADLQELRPEPDKHIEVLGFTSELIDKYACSTLGSDPPLLELFRNYLDMNQVIKSMMYIPLHCAIVVQIFMENKVAGKPVPQTMTQLYTQLTLTRLRNHLSREGGSRVALPPDLENLPKGIDDQLLSLAKLAFDGALQQKVIFNALPDGCSTLGLMVGSQELGLCQRGMQSFNFFHFTLQEFLSAFYISKLGVAERKELLQQEAFDQFHMKVVKKFVAGLTGFRDVGWHPSSAQTGGLTVDEFMLQELFEAQDKVDYESVFGDSTIVFEAGVTVSTLTVFDCFALGYCVAASGKGWRITFPGLIFHSSCSWAEVVQMLACGLKSRDEERGYIQHLGLEGCLNGPNDLLRLNELPLNVLHQISSLDVSQCRLDHVGLDELANVMGTMISLRTLRMGGNPEWNGATGKLLQAISYLRELDMPSTPLGCNDIVAISNLIRSPGSLKMLRIGDHSFSRETVDLTLREMLPPSSLEGLMLCNMDLTFASFSELELNHNLTELTFFRCTMLNKTLCSISVLLHSNTSLKKFQLYFVDIPANDLINVNGTVVALAEMLKANRTLNRLVFILKDVSSMDSCAAKEEENDVLSKGAQGSELGITVVHEIQQLRHQLLELERQLEDSHDEIQQLQNQLQSLEGQLEESRRETQQLRYQLLQQDKLSNRSQELKTEPGDTCASSDKGTIKHKAKANICAHQRRSERIAKSKSTLNKSPPKCTRKPSIKGKQHSCNSRKKGHIIICVYCGAKFTQPCQLKKHIRSHTGEKPFVCTFCGARFTQSGNLQVHVRRHTGEKPFFCTYCDAKFSHSSNLRQHIRTHTGEKPCACTYCDAKFAHQSTLRNHIRTHTGEKPFTCTFCDARYTDSSNLRRHIAMHTR